MWGRARSADNPPSVDQLLVAVAQGEHASFEALYDRTAAKVFGLVRRVVRDAAQAATDRDLRVARRDVERDYDVVSETVEARLESEAVREALGSLTALQRQAVQLAYYGGYTHSEISVVLGVPLGTVKTRIRDGLIRLRDAMGVTA